MNAFPATISHFQNTSIIHRNPRLEIDLKIRERFQYWNTGILLPAEGLIEVKLGSCNSNHHVQQEAGHSAITISQDNENDSLSNEAFRQGCGQFQPIRDLTRHFLKLQAIITQRSEPHQQIGAKPPSGARRIKWRPGLLWSYMLTLHIPYLLWVCT